MGRMNCLIASYAGFFLKKTLFSQIADQQIYEDLELINKRPMKLHDDQAPLAIFRIVRIKLVIYHIMTDSLKFY